MIDYHYMIIELRTEMRQIIRMLEDDVIVGNTNSIIMNVGKLVVLQNKLDELENKDSLNY